LEGETSTWTFLRTDTAFYAVGSVHCGLYYHTHASLGKTFVSLPKAVIKLGVEKVGLKFKLADLEGADPQTADLVLVKVTAPPPNGCGWEWSGEAAPQESLRLQSVFGWSNSSYVGGEGALSLSHDGGTYRFVETQGVPGNSGTLLYGTRNGDTLTVLGTYFGILPRTGDLRCRGVISRLPRLDEFHFVEVPQTTTNVTFDVTTKSGVRTVTYDVGASELNDGNNKYPGIFITGTTKYCGSMHIGTCRAK
jgi:hypothetical protein